MIEEPDRFERAVSLSEKLHRDGLIAANAAFTAAMMKAIKRGREKIAPGTIVDTTPFVARIIRGYVPLSGGSPAAMCVDSGGPTGTLTLK